MVLVWLWIVWVEDVDCVGVCIVSSVGVVYDLYFKCIL